MRKIFSTIFHWWSSKNTSVDEIDRFDALLLSVEQDEFLLGLSDKLIMSSIDVYKTVCASLLPTPSKSHYTFNLRDLSKVFQGMLMMESKKIDVSPPRLFVVARMRACVLERATASSSVVP